jgi:hypothetical protein
MSTIQANRWESVGGSLRSTVLQTVATYSNTKSNTNTANAWVEMSTDYRVTITPTFANSMIHLSFYVPLNVNGISNNNCIKLFRTIRLIGGVRSNPTSTGGALGSRLTIAGHAWRSLNGYDLNDQQAETWEVIDLPGTTAPCTYLIEFLQEASAASQNFFGYSQSDNGTWGYSSRIIIIAREIAQ